MLGLDDLADLMQKYGAAYGAEVRGFDVRGEPWEFNGRPKVMGVVNLSPDSWYRESVSLSAEAAIERGSLLVAQGADAVDVGAESTLAHARRVSAEEQVAALVPVVEGLAGRGIRVSAETYERSVARAALEAGAAILNLTGNFEDGEIYRMAASHGAAVILCYVQGRHVRDVGDFNFAADVVSDMVEHFGRVSDLAAKEGVSRIFLDPGLGFYYRNMGDSSRRIRHQMEVFLQTFRLRSLGWPTCHALPHAFEHFREEVRSAEAFFAVLAVLGRTDLLRTHEVSRVVPVLRCLGAAETGVRGGPKGL